MNFKTCRTCNKYLPISSFPHSTKRGKRYSRPHCHQCKYQKEKESGYRSSEGYRIKSREYYKQYHLDNKEAAKHKALVFRDKKLGHTDTLSYEDYKLLIENSCYYCGVVDNLSVDRRDNTLGHSLHNCVACCEKCNIILIDIPAAAKDLLRAGLTEIAMKGLLEKWIIPMKRNR